MLFAPLVAIFAIGTQLGAVETLLSLLVHGQDAAHQHLDHHPGHEHDHSHEPDEERGSHGYAALAVLHQPAAPSDIAIAPVLTAESLFSFLLPVTNRLDLGPSVGPVLGIGPPDGRLVRLLVVTLLAPNSPPGL